MKRKLTYHGKKRVNERTMIYESKAALVRRVSMLGKTRNMYRGKFYQYLLSKSNRGAQVKVYNDYVYIMSKNSRRLITLYPVPEKYLPIKQYEIPRNVISMAMRVNSFLGRPVIIVKKDDSYVKGYILKEFVAQTMKNVMVVSDGEKVVIDIENIKEVKEMKTKTI